MNSSRLTVTLGATMLVVVMGFAPAAVAQFTNIEVINHPGAVATYVYGINDAGVMAGGYYEADNVRHGFVFSHGQFATIDYPQAKGTWAYKVNARGEVAGTYSDSSNKQHGFVLRGGAFQSIDFPEADQTMVYGLNSRGDLTGMYFANGNTTKHYGWALIGGRFITIDHPLPNLMSCGSWIGDSGVVGGHVLETNGAYHGYLWKDGEFTLFEFEGGPKWNWWDGPFEVNGAGDILGAYTDEFARQRAFLLHNGSLTGFDVPGSRSTRATGMNALGQVVGLFVDAGGATHGFLTQLEPGWRSHF